MEIAELMSEDFRLATNNECDWSENLRFLKCLSKIANDCNVSIDDIFVSYEEISKEYFNVEAINAFENPVGHRFVINARPKPSHDFIHHYTTIGDYKFTRRKLLIGLWDESTFICQSVDRSDNWYDKE